MSRTLAARDTTVDAMLTFQVREDALLTRLQRRARAEQTAQVRERCGAANGLAITLSGCLEIVRTKRNNLPLGVADIQLCKRS